LAKRAVEEVPVSSIDPGFYSRLFLVPKKTGGMRPVIDLSILITYLVVPHFKMETNRSIRASILPGMWTTSLDLSDAYFHIPICHSYRRYLRFVWDNRVYQFRALPFGMSTALVFTNVMQAAIASFPGYSDSFLPERLSDQGTLSRETLSQHRCSHHTVSLFGVSHLMEKVRPDSFSGRTFPYSTGLSSSSTGKVSESLFESSSVSVSENSYFSPIFTTARSFEFSSGRCFT
jgi:hypothetical protein